MATMTRDVKMELFYRQCAGLCRVIGDHHGRLINILRAAKQLQDCATSSFSATPSCTNSIRIQEEREK